jgi:hypothetical protein
VSSVIGTFYAVNAYSILMRRQTLPKKRDFAGVDLQIRGFLPCESYRPDRKKLLKQLVCPGSGIRDFEQVKLPSPQNRPRKTSPSPAFSANSRSSTRGSLPAPVGSFQQFAAKKPIVLRIQTPVPYVAPRQPIPPTLAQSTTGTGHLEHRRPLPTKGIFRMYRDNARGALARLLSVHGRGWNESPAENQRTGHNSKTVPSALPLSGPSLSSR